MGGGVGKAHPSLCPSGRHQSRPQAGRAERLFCPRRGRTLSAAAASHRPGVPMAAGRYYLTAAIPYANGEPHIGHAYEVTAVDVMARFMRLDGYDVRFQTGMDEHGQKIEQTARKLGIA